MFSFKKNLNLISIRNLFLILFFVFSAQVGYSQDSYTCGKIEFRGLDHVSTEEANKYLSFHENELISNETINLSIKNLYDSHKFESVRVVQTNEEAVIFEVKEFPILLDINIEGNNFFSKDFIKEVLRSLNIYEKNFFDKRILSEFKEKMLFLYKNALRNRAQISYEINGASNGIKSLKICISENEVAKIKSIHFFGNKDISSDIISSFFNCYKRSWYFLKYFRDDYTFSNFQEDLQNLYHFYNTQGYLCFNIFNTELKYSNENKDVDIFMNIYEGDQFYISNISLNEDFPIFLKEEKERISQKNINILYNIDNINLIKLSLLDKLFENGYLNAKIDVLPFLNNIDNKVDISIRVYKGEKFILNEISFQGNKSVTKKYLINNFLQKEHTFINKKKLFHDLEYLRTSGFFENIDLYFKPCSVENSNLLDLVIYVKESKPNSCNFGIGYDAKKKLNYNIQLKNTHLLGMGNSISLDFLKSFDQNFVKILYTNPSFLKKSGCMLRLNFFLKTANKFFIDNKLKALDLKNHFLKSFFELMFPFFDLCKKKNSLMIDYGLNQALEMKLSPTNSVSFSISCNHHENNSLNDLQNKSNIGYQSFYINDSNILSYKNVVDNLCFNSTFSHQELMNNYFFNTSSNLVCSVDYNFLLKNKRGYFKLLCEANKYIPILKKYFDLDLLIHSYFGYKPLEDNNSEINDYDNFYANNHCYIRGYKFSSLGPKVYYDLNNPQKKFSTSNSYNKNDLSCRTIGGNIFSINSLELISSIPFSNSSYLDNFRVSAFLDFGNIWKKNLTLQKIINKEVDYTNPSEMYCSYGASIKWKSPFGLVSFSYALPIGSHDKKDLEGFQINFGC
jgi:outer membrane protein insertion porin family